MPTVLDPQLKRALADRIRYYNELGIYDFYRRDVSPGETAVQIQPEERDPLPRAKAAVVSHTEELVEISEPARVCFCRPCPGTARHPRRPRRLHPLSPG